MMLIEHRRKKNEKEESIEMWKTFLEVVISGE